MFEVIAYYNFNSIENVERFCADHRRQCQSLQLLGRVYVAHEGINGTLAGDKEAIAHYQEYLHGLSGFQDTEFKVHSCPRLPFPDLRIKIRPEIVAMKTPIHLDPKKEGGEFLSPKQWKETLESGDDFILLDVRNDYETNIGHFDGAICPDVENFYDFPEWLEKKDFPKDKKVLMYCTGGIRCEKFSVLMKEKGHQDVNQLQGGILNYALKEGGKHYKGKCFVFDDRMSVEVDQENTEPISRCEITGVPCDTYINCANMVCNKLFVCTREGAIRMQGCCSLECKNNPERRPLNIEELYTPFRRWYQYFDESDKRKKILKSAVS